MAGLPAFAGRAGWRKKIAAFPRRDYPINVENYCSVLAPRWRLGGL
jgi:hypothetical protein